MGNLLKIRSFTRNDLERVEDIEKASIKYLTPLSLLSHFYEIPPEGFLVAEIDGRVVGYVIGNVQNTLEGHILAIAVDPAYRKRGVGTALLRSIIDVLKDKGVDKIRVELKLYNTDARKLYSSLGFKESYIARGYYRARGYTEDALIMIKSV